jgi:hypothetical protein
MEWAVPILRRVNYYQVCRSSLQLNFSTPGSSPVQGKDRPVTAREIGNPSGVHNLSFGVVRLTYYSPRQRVLDIAVKKEEKKKGDPTSTSDSSRVASHRIACPQSLRLRIHMHTQVSSQHMH